MIIRTIGFNPIKVMADSTEVPVEEISYLDEDGVTRILDYIVLNGEKIPIQYRSELMVELSGKSVEVVLEKVEIDRKKKIEDVEEKKIEDQDVKL